MVKVELVEKFYPNGSVSNRASFCTINGRKLYHGYYEEYTSEGKTRERVFLKYDREVGLSITLFWK